MEFDITNGHELKHFWTLRLAALLAATHSSACQWVGDVRLQQRAVWLKL